MLTVCIHTIHAEYISQKTVHFNEHPSANELTSHLSNHNAPHFEALLLTLQTNNIQIVKY